MGFLSKALGGLGLDGDKLLGEGSGRYRGELAGIIGQGREANRLFSEQAMQQLVAGLNAQLKGYDTAIEGASTASRSARRGVLERGGQLEADLVGQYGQGGRFGTTALDNARMGLASSLSRDLESIDASFAGLMSDLEVGQGAAEAGARGTMANLSMLQGGREMDLISQLAGTLKPTQGGMLSDILGLAGAGLGASFGGPGGAKFGGEAGNILGGMFERS